MDYSDVLKIAMDKLGPENSNIIDDIKKRTYPFRDSAQNATC